MRPKLLPIPIALLLWTTAHAQEKAADSTGGKTVELQAVQVSAVTKKIEHAAGKTIVNVQATGTTAGKNVLDVLRQSPGITVDASGNITMSGKEGVLVLVDGRQTYLAGTELAEYLKGITADEVNQLELITQPGARYEAAGNAGVINIKTRRLRRKGLNGVLTPSYEQNVYHYSTNTLLLNYRHGKVNWYTNLNYINGQNGITWKQRAVYTADNGDTLVRTAAAAKPMEVYAKYNPKVGADWNYSDKLSAGFFVSGGYHTNTSWLENTTETQDLAAQGSTTSLIRNTTDETTRRNAAGNAYLRYATSKASELTVNADYVLNTKQLQQDLATRATRDGLPVPGQLQLKDGIDYAMQVLSLKADHTVTTKKGMTLEHGLKYSDTHIDNDARFDTYDGTQWAHDAGRSNHFLYHEQISAAYLNGTRKAGERVEAQLGLRGELAVIEGTQRATGAYSRRVLPALFPTLYVRYKADSSNSLEVNYGRRVERPRYYALNPFNNYTFWNTFERGNPELLPQYSHNAELKHSYKDALSTSLQLSYTRDVITSVLVADAATQTVYGTSVNAGTTRSAYLSTTWNGTLWTWWEMAVMGSVQYTRNNGVLNNKQVQNDGYGFMVYTTHNFKVGKWILETELSYTGKTVQSLLTKQNPQVVWNMGASRKFLHDSCTVRVGINDPLYVYRLGWTDRQPNYYHTGDFIMNSRSINTAVTYSFGKNGGQKRNYAGPEEAKRI